MVRSLGRQVVLSLVAGALVFPAAAQVPPIAGATITWHVENSFRFFTDAADTEVHRATYLALHAADQLERPVLAAEQALSRRHDAGWSQTMVRKTCWDVRTHRFSCGQGENYINPQSHTIVAKINGIDEAAYLNCTWLTSPFGGSDPRGAATTQPCSAQARFRIPFPSGAKIAVEIGGREIVSEVIKVRDLFVVGMGDSIGSGEGNPDVPVKFSRERSASYGEKTDTDNFTGFPARVGAWEQIGDKAFIEENPRWHDQACHRSLYSHQLRAALQLGIEDPHRAVTYVGVACSGAEVTYGLFLRYTGNEWVPHPPDMSQISAIASAQCGSDEAPLQDLPEAYHMRGRISELKGGLTLRKCNPLRARKIDLLFLSIGGNDVGFARLLANAVLANQSTLRKLGGWIGQVHGLNEARAQLNALKTRYKSLNRALHSLLHIPWEQSDRVVLMAYPGLALLGDGSEVCPDGRAGMEILPDFKMSESKARVGTWIADKLHHAMRDAAKAYHWSFVEAHRREFIGRGICAGTTEGGADIADELRLPRKTGAGWQPYNPADYQSYASRRRWFRTPNDAFMTGNFHVAGSILQKVLKLNALSWFQLVLASTYSGAFHPTAEGQAAMADALVHKSRAVLDKYAQGLDPIPARSLDHKPSIRTEHAVP
jgi:hypothetical protein